MAKSPLEKRRKKLRQLIDATDGYSDVDCHEEDVIAGLVEADQFLLVERSTRDNRYWFSTYPTVEDCGRANIDQEYAGDWDLEDVIEIDTGERWEVEFVAVAKKRVPA